MAMHVDQNDKAVMEPALNNAKNTIEHYTSLGESVAVEVVTYGPGLHVLRKTTSPVRKRFAVMALGESQSAVLPRAAIRRPTRARR